MSKVRRVEFYPDEFLVGVAGMTAAEVGVYWTVCGLIYSTGGAIGATDERLFRLLDERKSTVLRLIDKLIQSGKILRTGDELMVKRCCSELERVVERILSATGAASKRWRTEDSIPPDQGVTDATAESGAMLTNNLQPSTFNSISPEHREDGQVVDFPGSDKPQGRRRKNQDQEPEGFAPAYDAFPRKDDPDDAARAFGRVVRSGKATAAELLAAARAYAKDRAGQDPKFTKQMATWLNKGSYRNAPPQARSGGCPL